LGKANKAKQKKKSNHKNERNNIFLFYSISAHSILFVLINFF